MHLCVASLCHARNFDIIFGLV